MKSLLNDGTWLEQDGSEGLGPNFQKNEMKNHSKRVNNTKRNSPKSSTEMKSLLNDDTRVEEDGSECLGQVRPSRALRYFTKARLGALKSFTSGGGGGENSINTVPHYGGGTEVSSPGVGRSRRDLTI